MNYRRYYVPNAIVFITQVVDYRQPVFRDERWVALLRATLHRVQELHPFVMVGYVFLPDHLHLLIKPVAPTTHTGVMHSLKMNFSKAYKAAQGIQGNMRFWQQRYYDHIIRDEDDLEHHLHYIHYNPVKHGLVTRPEQWPHSSFAAWKERGAYADGWGWSLEDTAALWNAAEME